MSQQQQTILRVSYNNTTGITEYEVLDTYNEIPIRITRSFAELQDISKKNSDTAINVKLPGSKINNKFFENYFDVDVNLFKFNVLNKVSCQVLINDEPYFTGYLRLNEVTITNTEVEYDVSLYNIIGNLYADIGNNLLQDLDFNDPDYTFNHTFNQGQVTANWYNSNFGLDREQPLTHIYPVVHNGYIYTGNTVNFTGGTADDQTRLYTSSPILAGAYTSTAAAISAGVKPYRINSPNQGLIDNQLKPAISVWNILQLIFKTYGYTIKSDFMNTPWMKTLYMYGYFSSNATKFSYQINEIPTLPPESCEIIFKPNSGLTAFDVIVVQKGTGIPCFCSEQIDFIYWVKQRYVPFIFPTNIYYLVQDKVVPQTSGTTINLPQTPPPNSIIYRRYDGWYYSSVGVADISELKYNPVAINDFVQFEDGDFVNFSQVIDPQFRQIDFLSSIAKKFNLIFIPDPDVPNGIIIEPYTYYVGTGNIYDWTDKISMDSGVTVEPALNNIDSYLVFSDSEDGDYGNITFKNTNNRIYGQKFESNNTDFKSSTGETKTFFGPQIFRQWDTPDQLPNGGIDFPLGINYAGTTNTQDVNDQQIVHYQYTGVKTKPKLMWFLQGNNVLNQYADSGVTYNATYSATTYTAWVHDSNGQSGFGFENIPIMSNAMPIGMSDQYKINNDSLSLLFNAEQLAYIDVSTYTTYTYNDCYDYFYANRVNNLYNPNTRFLKGKFQLSLSDYKNLKPQDIIKIKDQYFTWNKISNFNVTNTELTDVELVQYNLKVNTYPTRYFKYYYCDDFLTCYVLKTDFTNPNLLYTNFGWSVLYDHNCGIIYGQNQPSGYTSTFFVTSGATDYYIPYFIEEINQDEYENGGCLDYTCDKLLMHIYGEQDGPFWNNMPTYYFNSGGTISGMNLFKDCSTFNTIKTSAGIRTASSTIFGLPDCAPPTATYSILAETTEVLNTEINQNIQIEH